MSVTENTSGILEIGTPYPFPFGPVNIKEIQRLKQVILQEPERFGMEYFIYQGPSVCGTTMCFSGWVNHLHNNINETAGTIAYADMSFAAKVLGLPTTLIGGTDGDEHNIFFSGYWPEPYKSLYYQAMDHKERALVAADLLDWLCGYRPTPLQPEEANVELLQQLYQRIKDDPAHFDMDYYGSNIHNHEVCGTVCCFCGHINAITGNKYPDDLNYFAQRGQVRYSDEKGAAKSLDISSLSARILFHVCWWPEPFRGRYPKIWGAGVEVERHEQRTRVALDYLEWLIGG